jgi:ketosteroid isomerase-like protein
MSDWLDEFYADVDAMRMDAFLDHFTDDAVVEFANNPQANGKAEIREAIGGLWSSIGGLSHDIHQRYDQRDRSMIEATCTYTRQDGSVLPLPTSASLARRDGKVEKLKVYMDLAPLFAEEQTEAAAAQR